VLATATGVVPTVPGAPPPTATLAQQATTIATQPTATPTGAFDELTGDETPAAEATAIPAETPVATSEAEATAMPALEAETPEAEATAEVALAPQGGATYTVRWGDTLFSIAQRFGTTVDAIKNANGLTSDLIYVGQELNIPGGGVPDGPGQPGGPGVHIVQPGENLFRIALRYGTTVDAIARANRITNPWFIYVGQRLNIPGGGRPGDGPMPPDGPGRTHVVQPGETLYSIALRYDTTVRALVVANNLPNANYIYVGQVLNVP
jgi:LysM repeat protein